jgi:hypothetical protein
MPEPVVRDAAEAAGLEFGAAIVLDQLREFLDAAGLGAGEIEASELGDGHSNLTFLLRRGSDRLVLRRPPRGDLAGSANDVLREARILTALGNTALQVPEVLGRSEDPGLIGAPFFLMSLHPRGDDQRRAAGGARPAGGAGTDRRADRGGAGGASRCRPRVERPGRPRLADHDVGGARRRRQPDVRALQADPPPRLPPP